MALAKAMKETSPHRNTLPWKPSGKKISLGRSLLACAGAPSFRGEMEDTFNVLEKLISSKCIQVSGLYLFSHFQYLITMNIDSLLNKVY